MRLMESGNFSLMSIKNCSHRVNMVPGMDVFSSSRTRICMGIYA